MSDLISREALLENMEKYCDMQDLYLPTHFIDMVEDVPTVEAVPVVHGEWIDGCCSNCGAYVPTDSRIDFISEEDCNFCYSCGASMRTSAE